MEFKDKVAVITGASSGIGKQMAFDLASLGCKVVLVARGKENLLKAKKEISQIKTEVMAISCDVSDRHKVEALAQQLKKKFGKVDILVNAAGYGNHKKLEDSGLDEFEQMMKTNYFGTVYMIKALLPMMQKDGGCIINISSIAGMIGMPSFSNYTATKWAVLGFSESLYNEFYSTNIKITVVCPGQVETKFFDDPSFNRFKERKTPIRKLKPVEVSRAAINAMRKGKFLVVLPRYARLISLMKSVMPNSTAKLLRRYS